eukprot:TRINITY_DN3078_c0_g8_i1.p1 TRINITY_DN3078_c0_g8~~TRINITY_DN3078_c0_g8_i1.p1  ORF type:complete len:564 (+),score=212.82 TRINITY_DN3078_c0_g8_i1:28-1719(+)
MEKPKWQKDDEVSSCTNCSQKFSVTKRRHHCRACGLIFCKKCSSKKLPLPQYDFKSIQRVCDTCYLDEGPRIHQTNFQNETAIKVQNYIRDEPFKFVADLKELGNRQPLIKSFFLANDSLNNNEELLMSMISLYKEDFTFSLEKKNTDRISKVLKSIKHPYITPIKYSFFTEADSVLILRPFYKEGVSLRDKMYGVKNSKQSFQTKYSSSTPKRLPDHEIASYGRKILEGLLYFKKKTYPYLHLHAGNVIVTQNKLYLTDYENSIFNLTPNYQRFIPNVSQEVQLFGVLLFELITGNSNFCFFNESGSFLSPAEILSSSEFAQSNSTLLKNVISSIFSPPLEGEGYVTVESLLKQEPFVSVSVDQIPKVKLSQNTSDFLVYVNGGNNKLVEQYLEKENKENEKKKKQLEEEENDKRKNKKDSSTKSSQNVRLPGTKKKKKKSNKPKTENQSSDNLLSSNNNINNINNNNNNNNINYNNAPPPPPLNNTNNNVQTNSGFVLPKIQNKSVSTTSNPPPNHVPPPPPSFNAGTSGPPPPPPPPPSVSISETKTTNKGGRGDLLAAV